MRKVESAGGRRLRLAPAVLGLSLVAGGAAPGGASSLAVQSVTAHTGTWATRIDVERTCSVDDRTVSNGTDYTGTATEEACVSVTANDVDVLAGADVTFRAGERVSLGSGFSVSSGGAFRAVVGPEVAGAAYLESGHPANESEYWARFYILPDDLDLTGGGSFLHFTASDSKGGLELAVGLLRNLGLGENRVFLRVVEDGGAVETTEGSEELALSDGWHFLELRWRASSGANDGLAEICVDTSPGEAGLCASLTGLDNDTGRIDSVRWGALEVSPGDLGTIYMDDFRAQSAGPIGACESAQECP